MEWMIATGQRLCQEAIVAYRAIRQWSNSIIELQCKLAEIRQIQGINFIMYIWCYLIELQDIINELFHGGNVGLQRYKSIKYNSFDNLVWILKSVNLNPKTMFNKPCFINFAF